MTHSSTLPEARGGLDPRPNEPNREAEKLKRQTTGKLLRTGLGSKSLSGAIVGSEGDWDTFAYAY